MLLKIPFPFVEFPWNSWHIWVSELQIFKWRESLISSQVLFELSASDISVCINPLDFACAYLVLLSLVKSEAVLISMNQSSNCEESLLLKIVISWVECSQRMFPFVQYIRCLYVAVRLHQGIPAVQMGKVWELTLLSLHSRWLMVSIGWFSLPRLFVVNNLSD